MKNYIKPVIDEELIEIEDVIAESNNGGPQEGGDVYIPDPEN